MIPTANLQFHLMNRNLGTCENSIIPILQDEMTIKETDVKRHAGGKQET